MCMFTAYGLNPGCRQYFSIIVSIWAHVSTVYVLGIYELKQLDLTWIECICGIDVRLPYQSVYMIGETRTACIRNMQYGNAIEKVHVENNLNTKYSASYC